MVREQSLPIGNVAENNVLPAIVVVLKIGIAAYTAYEMYETAKQAVALAEDLAAGRLTNEQLVEGLKSLGITLAEDVVFSKLKVLDALGDLVRKVGDSQLIRKLESKIDEVRLSENDSKNGTGKTTGCSFTPDTPVLMADGSFKAIADIRLGDLVASRDEFTGEWGANPVTALLRKRHDDRVVVTLASADGQVERIVTTLEHPFHVQGRGFVPAEALRVGMKVSHWVAEDALLARVGFRGAEAAKGYLLVRAVTITRSGATPWTAYNLTVANHHTFFVGKSRAWVHNECQYKKIFNLNRLPERRRVAVNKTIAAIRANPNEAPSWLPANRKSKWGEEFRNDKEYLPKVDSKGNEITYRVYDVMNTMGERGAGVERVVVGSDGRWYYTGTHYGDRPGKPFVRIK